jgi:cell division protein FtsL
MKYNNNSGMMGSMARTWGDTAIRVSPLEWVGHLFSRKNGWVPFMVMGVVMVALCVVTVTNETRVLFSNIQSAQSANNNMQILQGKLLLESGALSSQAYVQRIAQEKLHMVPSTNQNTVTVEI